MKSTWRYRLRFQIVKIQPESHPRSELTRIIDRWVEARIYEVVLKLVARVSNQILLCDSVYYNEGWAQASMAFAENIALTMMILRLFPPFLRPFTDPAPFPGPEQQSPILNSGFI